MNQQLNLESQYVDDEETVVPNPRYKFEPFSNEFFAVDVDGIFIRVCVKNSLFARELTHPFPHLTSKTLTFQITERKPKKIVIDGIDEVCENSEVAMRIISKHRVIMTLSKKGVVFAALSIKCTNPRMTPKPMKITEVDLNRGRRILKSIRK